MPQVVIKAFRFHEKHQLELYKKEGEEKGLFEFPKPIAKFEASEDKIIRPILDQFASVELKGTILKAFKKNDDGYWDYCCEMEGKAKGEFGLEETAESKAAHAQKGEPGDGSEEEAGGGVAA